MGEAEYLFRSDRFNMIFGGGFIDTSGEDQWDITGLDPFTVNLNVRHYNAYLYTYTRFPSNVTWIIGASADWYHQTDYLNTDQFNPKFGMIWNITPATTMRAAAFRTFKRTLLNDATLEPTQVAGFNQFYDDVDGTDSWRYGIGLDQKFSKTVFGGVEVSMRDISTPYTSLSDGTLQKADWTEKTGRAYLFWTPNQYLSLSAEYLYEYYSRDRNTGAESISSLTTNSVPLGASFFHPIGLYARAIASYVYQKGDFAPLFGDVYEDSSSFWVVDAVLGYRFPKRYGTFELGVKNATNQTFKYQDMNPSSPTIYPDRFYYGRVTLSF
jgi:hypothetical protein